MRAAVALVAVLAGVELAFVLPEDSPEFPDCVDPFDPCGGVRGAGGVGTVA